MVHDRELIKLLLMSYDAESRSCDDGVRYFQLFLKNKGEKALVKCHKIRLVRGS